LNLDKTVKWVFVLTGEASVHFRFVAAWTNWVAESVLGETLTEQVFWYLHNHVGNYSLLY